MSRSNQSGSTGEPYSTLTSRETDGSVDLPPCASKDMNASKPTPPSGESVSDEQLPDDFEDAMTDEVITCRHLLRQCVKPDTDPEHVLLCFKEARARLQQIEQWGDRVIGNDSINHSAVEVNSESAEGGCSNSET